MTKAEIDHWKRTFGVKTLSEVVEHAVYHRINHPYSDVWAGLMMHIDELERRHDDK